nr:protein Daple-like [Ipomoea batatas]
MAAHTLLEASHPHAAAAVPPSSPLAPSAVSVTAADVRAAITTRANPFAAVANAAAATCRSQTTNPHDSAPFNYTGPSRSAVPKSVPTVINLIDEVPSLRISPSYRYLDPTVVRGIASKLSQDEYVSLDEWLGEEVEIIVPTPTDNMTAPSRFTNTWFPHISNFTPPSYPGLDGHRTLICDGGPFDQRRYHDPIHTHQLSTQMPFPPLTSTPHMYRVYRTRGQAASNTPSDDEDMGVLPDPTIDGGNSSMMDVEVGGPSCEPARDPAPPSSDRPPSPWRDEYEPHKPLAARGVGMPPPRALHPYKPNYIEAIRHGVQDMLTMQALGQHHRLQEAMREYAESEQVRMALANDLSRSEERYGRVKQRQIDHVAAMQGDVLDWRGTPDFVRAADELALTRMPLLLQSWLATSNMSGQPMVDVMAGWFDVQHFMVPPPIKIFQDWAITPGGRLAMGGGDMVEGYERRSGSHSVPSDPPAAPSDPSDPPPSDQGTGGTGIGDSVNPSSLEGYTLLSGSSVSGSAEGWFFYGPHVFLLVPWDLSAEDYVYYRALALVRVLSRGFIFRGRRVRVITHFLSPHVSEVHPVLVDEIPQLSRLDKCLYFLPPGLAFICVVPVPMVEVTKPLAILPWEIAGMRLRDFDYLALLGVSEYFARPSIEGVSGTVVATLGRGRYAHGGGALGIPNELCPPTSVVPLPLPGILS